MSFSDSVPGETTFAFFNVFLLVRLPVAWHHLPARQPDSALLCALLSIIDQLLRIGGRSSFDRLAGSKCNPPGLTILEALHLATGRPAYRVVFDFWLKIFGVTFGMGVVSGIVMAFQFGTNWEVLARMTGPIQGVLLTYETFTAFFLEASFFGILLFGRPRVPPWFYLFSTAMVALGTTLSAFWIMANNSWMQAPTGYVVENGAFVPTDWAKIVFSPVLWVRFPHMLLASFITGAFCVAATGAWYLLREKFPAEAYVMLRMGLFLAAILVPVQIFFGHLNGDYVHDYQPAKFAAIEARWHDEQPAGEVLIAIPDEQTQTNYFEIKVPVLGSLIGKHELRFQGGRSDRLSKERLAGQCRAVACRAL